MKISKSQLFKTAWTLFKTNIFATFSDSLRAAWKELKLRVSLKVKTIRIKFRKANGEITEREATTNPAYFATTGSGKSEPKAGLIKFFSLTDDGWRACRIERLISVN